MDDPEKIIQAVTEVSGAIESLKESDPRRYDLIMSLVATAKRVFNNATSAVTLIELRKDGSGTEGAVTVFCPSECVDPMIRIVGDLALRMIDDEEPEEMVH